jgi:hypothetical protein
MLLKKFIKDMMTKIVCLLGPNSLRCTLVKISQNVTIPFVTTCDL